ncbi:MAG: hypothetical protein IPN01_37700 [Deltaproteobacteria bacterium]|nr:hypothetical protein [Deltaproteobacteria bacterium]
MPKAPSDDAALRAYLAVAAAGGDEVAASRAAAEAVAADPWRVVEEAGALARAKIRRAPKDGALSRALRLRAPHLSGVKVSQGQPIPTLDPERRKALGAWDTPRSMARRLVGLLAGHDGGLHGPSLDPACGAGALLLAQAERSRGPLIGEDVHAAALAVAQVAVPQAQLRQRDGLAEPSAIDEEPPAILLINPPFVRAEAQDKATRAALVRRLPWLIGRWDLSIPFLILALSRVRRGGLAAMVLPSPALAQPYGLPLRQRLLAEHGLITLTDFEGFTGAGASVALGLARAHAPHDGPCWAGGPKATALLGLHGAPIHPKIRAGDPELAARARRSGQVLGDLFEIDTGVVAHGPGGGKAALLSDEPGPGRVPYVDAQDLKVGRVRYLLYAPERMHRAKRPALFLGPKLLIQRITPPGQVLVTLDEGDTFAGHTLNVLRPRAGACLDGVTALEALGRVQRLLRHPLTPGLLRLERGPRLDLYPHDLAAIPLPPGWLRASDDADLGAAYGLSPAEVARLVSFGSP